MKRLLSVLFTLFLASGVVQAAEVEGLIVKKSQFSVSETITRLENALTQKGITVALRWNHAGKADAVGIPLRPTELLIFGNPKLGSNMFTSQQTAGIDLPMKALAWQDENGDVWLGYNDPNYIASRHGITDRAEVVKKMTGALNKMSNIAIGAE